ncbi:MAG: GGDEF/EAL domain-containing response regulator [Silanimonas sp.]
MSHDRPGAGDDSLVFAQEAGEQASPERAAWTILVVDDEPDVYAATCMAMRGVEILGRPLQFLHAESSAQAYDLLQAEPDIAVILLDVVMESESAGLDLVARIRTELQLHKPRIILRTGQPGYAPEMQAIRDYDINDYRIKSELTRTRLYTVLTSALRGYQTLSAVEATRNDLEYLLKAQTELLSANTMPAFAVGLLERLAGLYGLPPHAVFCSDGRRVHEAEDQRRRVIAALGRYANWSWRRLDSLGDEPEVQAIELAVATRHTVTSAGGIAVYLPSRTGADAVAFLGADDLPATHDPRVFDMFVQNTTVAADGVRLVERLRDAAYVDGLTRLPNRSALAETVDAALKAPPDAPQRLLLIDVDQFSEINETFGDRIGDALLRGVAQRLMAQADASVRVARVANDTFAAFGPRDRLVPAEWAKRLDEPFDVEDLQIGLSASFGGVELVHDYVSGGEVIKMGYSALKRAKQTGHRSVAFYSHEVATEIKERTRLLHGLRAAFDQQRLFLMYQPQVEAKSGRTVGLEALMRWRSDNGRLVPPERFIPIAEQSGLIKDLGAWAMRSAIHCAAQLREAGHPLRMAVNVSMSQLLVPGFEVMVAEALADGGLPAELLEIEITESVAMQSPDIVLPRLAALKQLGVCVAIDDFGTGFSSLSSLEKLAPERLKIDRSFVMSLDAEHGGGSLAEMIIELGRTLGLTVIAEGVETATQRQRLVDLGCHELQGYLFSPPLAVDALREWLARHGSGDAP